MILHNSFFSWQHMANQHIAKFKAQSYLTAEHTRAFKGYAFCVCTKVSYEFSTWNYVCVILENWEKPIILYLYLIIPILKKLLSMLQSVQSARVNNSKSNECFVITSNQKSKSLWFSEIVNKCWCFCLKKENTNTDLHSDGTSGQSVCTITYYFNHASS